MVIYIFLIFIILLSYLLSYFNYKYLKIPRVITLILIGIIFGLEPLKELFILNNEYTIEILGQIGLFSLMFLAGLESNFKKLISEEKDDLIISFFGIIIPFLIGCLFSYFVLDFNFLVSSIIGISMSITAEATTTRVLIDIRKLNSKLGSIMIGSGFIDDIFGIISFSILLFFAGLSNLEEYISIFGVMIFFILGILIQKYAREHHITKKTEIISNNFLVPFFFISMGINFNLFHLDLSFKLITFIILIAFIGKYIAIFLAKFFLKDINLRQTILIGSAMNSRGAIGIAVILISLDVGLIDTSIYSALILMTLFTTLLFPFHLNYVIKRYPEILNE